MILSTHGIVGSISGIDADYLAYYNRVIAAGGSLTTTEQNATLQLVLDLKANSLWTSMKAIYPMVGASAAACSQNLKSSSFTGTFTATGWTFASTGVTGNGTSAYVNTNYNPSVSGQLNSAHLSIYFRTNLTGGNAMIGANDGNGRHYFGQGNTFSSLNSLGEGNYNPSSYAGFHIIKRETPTETKQLYNGSVSTTSTILSVARTNLNLYIGARNNSGTPTNFNYNQYAFLSIGDGLTDTEASNFYTAVQAFQTTLSRNV